MECLKAPKPLNLDTSQNLAELWKTWKEAFIIFLQATESTEKPDVVKSSILLHCIGKQCKEIYDTFEFAEGEGMQFNGIIEKFDNHFKPRKNLTYMRFSFFTSRQEEQDKFDEFYTKLRKLSEDCEFNQLRDSLIKDMIIIGIRDKKLQKRLLRENDITLEKVLSNCRASEASKLQTKSIHQSSKPPPTTSDTLIHQLQNKNDNNNKELIKYCKFCSGSHQRGSCPAYGKMCNNCEKKGHFAKCCNSKNHNRQQQRQSRSHKFSKSPKRVNTVGQDAPSLETDTDSDSAEEFFLGSIELSNENNIDTVHDQSSPPQQQDQQPQDWQINLSTNDTVVTYKIDTRAQANVIPLATFKRLLKPAKLQKTKCTLTAYNQTPIDVAGQCVLRIKHRNGTTPTLFIVTKGNTSPILGLKTSNDLNLIRRINEVNKSNIMDEFSDCFGELGTLQEKYYIVTDPNVPPVIDACRNVPIPLRDRLKKELKRMEDMKIITKVTEPTDCVSLLVVAYKPNGSLRICLDPHNLNKAIKRHHHKLPTAEEILSQMSGAKYFTKLDASNAFWQAQLDEKSSKLLTFNTPFGRYRYLRMPYGIHSASEICQARIASIIADIEGAVNAQDDIIIWASSIEELHSRTRAVLEAIRKSGLKLRNDKCETNKSELTFLGHLISADGIKPDPRKTEAIMNMPDSTNVKELQKFLGMITYLGKFIPQLSVETAPLRTLLEKDVMWTFDKPQREAIKKLKELITSSPVLKYYNPNLPTRISSDASQEGLGAVLEQDHDNEWHPVTFASRSLTPAESNYCPLERETLSIVFACKRFREYVLGLNFDVYNDHQPLKSIFSKPLYRAPARIQRFLLRLQQFDFILHYEKGSKMFVTDTLSRAPLPEATPEISANELNAFLRSVITNAPMSDKRKAQFQEETFKDATLQSVKQYITSGWPEKSNLRDETKQFYSIRDELSINSDLILKGDRIVVPQSMRKEMLPILHIGHPGITKVKTRARSTLYWPGMNNQLDNLSRTCQQDVPPRCRLHNQLLRDQSTTRC